MNLKEALLAHIHAGAEAGIPEAEFEALALRIFEHQFERNWIYRGYCEARGAVPGSVGRWLDIPAVPTDAFKAAPLVCGEPAEAEVVFRTSGTTAGPAGRGAHYLPDTTLYRASLISGFRSALLADRPSIRILSLVPRFSDLPDSSLSFMIDEVLEVVGAEGSGTFVSAAGVDIEAFVGACHSARHDGVPALVIGTSFAFVHLLDGLQEIGASPRLPEGSRAMDTGGFKGRSREVEKAVLYSMISDGLGIRPAFIINEYGMTEMSSQFYDGRAGSASERIEARRHRGPGWVRTVAIDPETLEPLPAGETGILRHLDLANLDSVMALQTSDLGRVETDGSVELIGRARGATPRGCSIAMDELLRIQRAAEPHRSHSRR